MYDECFIGCFVRQPYDVEYIHGFDVGYKTFFMLNPTEPEIFILLINVKMPTIVGILTFISMINTTPEGLKAK